MSVLETSLLLDGFISEDQRTQVEDSGQDSVFDHIAGSRLDQAVSKAISNYQSCNGRITKPLLEDLHYLSLVNLQSI